MMIDAALRLSSNGTPIFPVKADKSPHIKSWQSKATTDQLWLKSGGGDGQKLTLQCRQVISLGL